MKKAILLPLIFLMLIIPVIAENQVNVYFFYGQGCPHCSSEEIFLDELEVKYPTLNIERYEVYQNNENRELFEQCSALSGVSIQGVPTTFIDKKAHMGFSNSIGADIESEIQRCLVEDCQGMMTDQNNNSVCETNIPTYNKEETVGYWLLGLIGAVILFFLIKKLFCSKKPKRKGLSSKKKTKK